MLRFQIAIVGSCESASLAVSFDSAVAVLERLPRMFVEPDGSFVWTGVEVDGQRWQVDGNLIDRGDVLAYVDVSGCCPAEQFDALLRAFGWPEALLAFGLTRSGQTLDEAAFRERARSANGAS